LPPVVLKQLRYLILKLTADEEAIYCDK